MHRIRELMVAVAVLLAQQAEASEAQRMAVLTTAMEGALATASLVKDRSPGTVSPASWSIRFSDKNWILELKGNNYSCLISGFLWGEDNAEWLATFAGSGSVGRDPMVVNGKGEWRYDPTFTDHRSMAFHNVVKFGENSFWGWVVGSEIIVGGAIGGGAGFVATSATGPGAVVVGLGAAIAGANATVALSNTVRTIVESDAPTPPPALPNRPPIPRDKEEIEPQKGKIVIAITNERVLGFASDGTFVLTGGLGSRNGSGSIAAR